ncbi:MAG: fibronectin type III domain-containing protein [Chitinophagaceae bacterium]
MKAQVKMAFNGLTIPAKVQKAGQLVLALTGNPAFAAPKPTLAEVDAAVHALEAAYKEALDGGKSKKASMLEREDELDRLVSDLADYVQATAGGNAETIRSSGFDVRAAPTPVAELEHVSNLRATISQRNGEVMLDWKPLNGARTYVIEKSTDGSNGWVVCGHSTRSHGVVTGLPSLTHSWFRVAGIGTTGQSPWSDIVKSLVA